MSTWFALIGGLALLLIGGDLLVRGAVQVAGRLGVSPLVIGLTLVGFGTSTPELVTSVEAALRGSPGIAYGNIVGSNIANILLILGLSALLLPIEVESRALKRDGMVMIGAAMVFSVIAVLMPLSEVVGAVFVVCLAVYIWLAFRQESTDAETAHGAVYDKSVATEGADPALKPVETATMSIWLALAVAVLGLVLVIFGGKFLVQGAVALARAFAISETVIGLTIVAVGTSLPELVTSVLAALRRQSDVALGNILGSNIYNILGIGGVTALIQPTVVPAQIVAFDNPVMVAVSVVVLIMAFTGRRISRAEGGTLVAGYVAYIAWMWPA